MKLDRRLFCWSNYVDHRSINDKCNKMKSKNGPRVAIANQAQRRNDYAFMNDSPTFGILKSYVKRGHDK